MLIQQDDEANLERELIVCFAAVVVCWSYCLELYNFCSLHCHLSSGKLLVIVQFFMKIIYTAKNLFLFSKIFFFFSCILRERSLYICKYIYIYIYKFFDVFISIQMKHLLYGINKNIIYTFCISILQI